MALTVESLNELNKYINKVMERADHHGQNVNEVILALAGAVIWKATDEVKVRTYNGETANALWFAVNGDRYATLYNHETGKIEIRKENQRGDVIAEFNNDSKLSDVKKAFASLG